MKIPHLLAFHHLSVLSFLCPLLLPLFFFCPTSSSGQAPVLRYKFSGSFPTQMSTHEGGGLRAQGIAVDGNGAIFITARGEGIAQFDSQGKYHGTFGYPDPEDERFGVDQNGNPATNTEMTFGQRASLRSADGKPFVIMPDAKTLAIQGHLFDPRQVRVNGGQVSAIDAVTGWLQTWSSEGLCSYFPIPTANGGYQKYVGFAYGKGTAGVGPSFYVLNSGARSISLISPDLKLVKTFGGPGSGAGQLSGPSCFATGLATGKQQTLLFVGDGTRVMVYGADGTFLYSFGTPGEKPGQFTNITVIVYYKSGHVFVLEGSRLQVFDETGHYLGLVADRQSDGSAAGRAAALNYADAVAVDISETIYLVDQTQVKIYKRLP